MLIFLEISMATIETTYLLCGYGCSSEMYLVYRRGIGHVYCGFAGIE
jgi:hypothetical protein